MRVLSGSATTMAEFIALGGSANDNCDTSLTLTHTDGPLVGGACGGTITRTYRVTDDCGNFAECPQTITVNDTTMPSLTAPANTTITGCNESAISGLAYSTTPVMITAAQLTNEGGSANDNCGLSSITYQDSKSGTCPVVVTRTFTARDLCNNTTSQAQAITIQGNAPTISSQPQGGTRCPGESITFSVAASGCGPFSYRWRKGGVAISGATSASYTLASIVATDAGDYDAVVTGACGSATSSAATLTVNSPTTIATAPVGGSRCAGQSITFTVTAGGTGPFSYQWRKGGVAISGATSASYTLASIVATDAGDYDAVVTGACGSATSSAATLTVNSATGTAGRPVGGGGCAGPSTT